MLCPKCGHPVTWVVRTLAVDGVVKRQRGCRKKGCVARWWTREAFESYVPAGVDAAELLAIRGRGVVSG